MKDTIAALESLPPTIAPIADVGFNALDPKSPKLWIGAARDAHHRAALGKQGFR
jgi:hypothetical protein